MKKILCVFFLCCSLFAVAQTYDNQKPASFYHHLKSVKTTDILPFYTTNKVNKAENTRNQKKLHFAHVLDTILIWKILSITDTLPDGSWVGRLKIKSAGAYSINMTIKDIQLPKGCRLYVYNADTTQVSPTYTHADITDYGTLTIPPVKGDEIFMEVDIPNHLNMEDVNFNIATIGHDYKNVFKILRTTLKSGFCNVNINCPQGEDWYKEKKSVCKIVVNNAELCSGAFVNNTKRDAKYYFITANHCISTDYNAQNTVFYFNYESAECTGFTAGAKQTISGARKRATSDLIDFTLVELINKPPDTFNVYWAGWNRGENPSQSSTGIHHPNGEIKKICIDYDAPITDSYGNGYNSNAHWKIAEWDVGVTESGSSGSPIFNEDHQITGTLTGGEAICGSPFNDYYAKFVRSWADYPEADRQLKFWLDPLNTSITFVNGYDKLNPITSLDAGIYKILAPEKTYCNQIVMNPKVVFNNNGDAQITKLIVGYYLNNDITVTKNWTGKLAINRLDTILFDPITLLPGKYKFKFFTQYPNDSIDKNKKNDTLVMNSEVVIGSVVAVEFTSDRFGDESSWKLMDYNNKLLGQAGPFATGASYTYLKNFCLSDGMYDLLLFDTNGDGFCCSDGKGSLRIINMTTQDTTVKNDFFSDKDSLRFYVNTGDKLQILNFDNLKLYPNPTDGLLDIYIKGMSAKTLKITDVFGKVLLTDKGFKNHFNMDLHYLSEGLYFIWVTENDKQSVAKIVLKRK